MPASTQLPRPPRQQRSRRTLARIVEAGLAILREQGQEGLTVQDVVARARTSVGSFYQRFSGKEELLRHLEGALVAEARSRFEGELAAGVSAEASLGAAIDAVVSLLAREPALDPALAAAAEVDRARADAVARVLLERGHEIRHEHPEAAVRTGFAAVAGALRAPPAGVPRAELVRELGRLWRSYLGAGGGGEPEEAVDFFEVWG